MTDTEKPQQQRKGLAPDEDSTEYYDSAATVVAKVARLAQHVREGRVAVFTGAGISTASKIPDYRGELLSGERFRDLFPGI